MYVNDIIRELDKRMIRIGNVNYYPAQMVKNQLELLADECVRWVEDDFQHMAIDKTSEDEWEEYYNKDMFSMALCEMTRKHDAELGINWQTVEYYLDTYCKIKDYHPIGQYK